MDRREGSKKGRIILSDWTEGQINEILKAMWEKLVIVVLALAGWPDVCHTAWYWVLGREVVRPTALVSK